MITSLRSKIRKRPNPEAVPTVIDPMVRNRGTISYILDQLKERLEAGCERNDHSRLTLDIRFVPDGVYRCDMMEGPSNKFM